MTIDEAIEKYINNAEYERNHGSLQGCLDFKQLAEWLKELKVFKARKGQWLRMSNLSEQEDDRYKCSYCGNVIHRKNKTDLYTFNSWCGRCGSDNNRK